MATPEPLVLSWLSLEQCEQAIGGLTAIKRWNGARAIHDHDKN